MASSSHVSSSQAEVSERSLPPGSDLDILIVGKTGHGKSATANSILGEECFPSEGDTTSVTSSSAVFQKEMDGRKLLVVDTPGLSDTGYTDTKQARQRVEKDFSLAISLSIEGFHAILLVFRYGQRMTKEEVDALTEMKALLGENFIRDHGILLVTYGDNFKKKMKGKKSFETWCKEQQGFMKSILQECQNRCLLFDNEGDEGVLAIQRFELVQMIDGMTGGKRYEEGVFKVIKETWRRDGDRVNRSSYLASCQIYFKMTGLVRAAKVYDQKFVDEMRLKLKELKFATKDLNELLKNKVDQKIKESEDKLNELEEKIKSSPDGYVEKKTENNVILAIISAMLAILLAALVVGSLGMVGAAVVAIWAGVAMVVGVVKRKCVIQ